VRRAILITSACCGLAAAAQAQTGPPLPAPPKSLPAAEAEIWPSPPPDPKAWWDDKWPKAPEAADPLGERKLGRGERLPEIANGIDPSTYRLWGLMPLQWQLLRGDEMILELWRRPAGSVRQSIVRVIVRRDGRAFVQGRAGIACCDAGIARRLGFDAELPAGAAQPFLALRGLPIWTTPRDVTVSESDEAVDTLCVEGTSYDVTLLVPGRATTLRRSCDIAAIGQLADVLEPMLAAALGHDPRFDVLYPGGPAFAAERRAYAELTAGGGRLRPLARPRRAAPGAEPAPQTEP
jgi:hypothetical protein